ncbi:hypothetical protein AKJ36_03540 [candidate division MSBL1 archaeon SCGC-AAA259I07]|uniref:Uncharacterized protein n=1 Tax=candidate division MSBL1 archaeon SCGC-AAA259I07 TaxID=1698266 RepID=A0A133UIP6_9EURY|nr:hypothetical protein AKJ36_03540 [candidate division MSBL1 archaeon SCGC-AAA259I07]
MKKLKNVDFFRLIAIIIILIIFAASTYGIYTELTTPPRWVAIIFIGLLWLIYLMIAKIIYEA